MIEYARRFEVGKFVVVGTVCSYPKFTPVPFREDDLWNGYPEETNAPYGIAKKALLVQAQAYRQQYGSNIIYVMPSNVYGPGDNRDRGTSHVIPALFQKFSEARETGLPAVTVWGDGSASRDFLYVDDAAEGIVRATECYDDGRPVNIGTGVETTIRSLCEQIAMLTGFTGEVRWDATRPSGQPRRCLDVSRAWRAFGFKAETPLNEGLRKSRDWYTQSGSRI